MKLHLALLLFLFTTTVLLAQDYRVNRDSLRFGILAIIYPEKLIDSVTITNIGTKALLIDSVYSLKHYGYRLKVKDNNISLSFFIYDPRDLINVTINTKDSAKFIFSKPDLCPDCSGSSLKPFKDTIFIHSNSITKPKLKLFTKGYGTTSVEVTNTLSDNYSLNQNFPNPFNPNTTIEYSIPKSERVTLKVFDVLGREVATLVNEYKQPGTYNCQLRIENGALPSGMYLYKLTAGYYTQTKKMILLK